MDDFDVRQVTYRALQHSIDQISRYLVTTKHALPEFAQMYAQYLEDHNKPEFWRSMERLAVYRFKKLELEVLLEDRLAPHGLLYRMMDIAKLQRKRRVLEKQLIPLYELTLAQKDL